MPAAPRPISERERQRQRQQIEQQVREGELTRSAADRLLDSLKQPQVIKE